jgi:hypothetical protein
MTTSATKKSVLKMRTQVQSSYSSWKQLFRPCALGFIGLAIVVALWGFSYKLSLYHRNTAPSARVSVARFWIEPRSVSATAASKLKGKSHLFPGSQALFVAVRKCPSLNRAVANILLPTTRGFEYLHSPIPSRSPPPHRFCLG